jgi:hypothetical protein
MAWVANSTSRPVYPQQRNPVPTARRLQYLTPTGFRSLDRPAFIAFPQYISVNSRKVLNVQLRRNDIVHGLLPVVIGTHSITVSGGEGGAFTNICHFLDLCVPCIGCKQIYCLYIRKQGPPSSIICGRNFVTP